MTISRQQFQWSGINIKGQRETGQIHATDIKEAQNELKKMGIEVISLTPKNVLKIGFRKRYKLKPKDILLFTRHMSAMISSGLTIPQALDIIANDQENPIMQSMLATIRNNVSSGKTLSETFSQYPQYFSELYINLVKAGEKSGSLDKIFNRLGNYLEKTEMLKNKIKRAMIYPSAILVIAGIVSLILLIFVVPQFQEMFANFGAKLPFFTRIILGISIFLRHYGWLLAIVLIVSVWFAKKNLKRNEKIKDTLDQLALKIFIIGPILKKGIVARYARTLATTLESGMPIVEAMKAMAPIMGNRLYAQNVLKISEDISSGHQLSISMSNTKLFPNMVVQMVAVGEASGSLSEMLNKLADYYEEEVNHMVDNLSSLLEPFIMALLGIIIGSFIVAMYLPIFKMGGLF
jgi:type IV pilus assembly protein PilC